MFFISMRVHLNYFSRFVDLTTNTSFVIRGGGNLSFYMTCWH